MINLLTRRNAIAAAGVLAIVAVFILFAFARQPAQADNGVLSAAERSEIEEIVRRYILDNPEIIPEAITNLQRREVARMIESNREDIVTPFEGAWAGNPDGDVVLVEFFDYNCPYCRQASGDVARLLKEDPDLKVVWRDFPVLGPASRQAALAALSAAKQDKYKRYHDAMFADERRVNQDKVFDVVRRTGLSEVRTAKDLDDEALSAELDANLALGRALGLGGTPAYVVGDRILEGAVGYDAMKEAIAEARAG
ncbi:MAG: DsbA family protein [Pseudomonadota bacterium]